MCCTDGPFDPSGPLYDSFNLCCAAQENLYEVAIGQCDYLPSICDDQPPPPPSPPTYRPTYCGERKWYKNKTGGVCTNLPAPAPSDSSPPVYDSLYDCC